MGVHYQKNACLGVKGYGGLELTIVGLEMIIFIEIWLDLVSFLIDQ